VQAQSFVDDASADGATENPSLVVTVTPRDESAQPVRLRVGRPCAGESDALTVVRDGPGRVSACVPKTAIDPLRIAPKPIVDTAALYAHADEIEEITLEPVGGGGSRIDLARRNTGWHERLPEDRQLDADATDSANAFVGALANARAIDAHPAKASEAFAPRARLSIVRTGDEAREVVEIGPPGADGTAVARRLDDGAILRFGSAAAHRFEAQATVLRPLAVWHPPFAGASVIAIDDGCGPEPSQLRLVSGAWTSRKLPAGGANGTAIDDFVAGLAHARAQAWVSESDDGTFGFAGPGACRVTLTLGDAEGGDGGREGATRRVGLMFGSEAEGGVFARTLDDPAVFVAAKALRSIKMPEQHPERSRASSAPGRP
jgi:hypothetical protein